MLSRLWLFLIAMLSLAGCGPKATSPAASPLPADVPVLVTVAQPRRQTLNAVIEQPGSVQPFEMAPIEARVSGYVKTVKVDLGSEVRGMQGTEPGAVLAEQDVPELVQDFERKKAGVELAKAEEDAAQKAVAVAEARIKTARPLVEEARAGVVKAQADLTRWESELARLERLAQSGGTIDQQTRDEAKRQAESSRASKLAAEAKVAGATAVVEESIAAHAASVAKARAAHAMVRVAEADAIRASIEVGYATIRAPFDGIITARYVHPGHLLKPSTTPAHPLFLVARLDRLRVTVDVAESVAASVVPGGQALIRVPAQGGREYASTIARTSRIVQADTRSMRAEIDLINTDGLLKPGAFVVVRVPITIPDALLVPPAAVLLADETAYVFAVEENKIVKYRVQTGRSDPAGVQVIQKRKASQTSGDWSPVTLDERLVVGNLGALAEGQPVSIKTP